MVKNIIKKKKHLEIKLEQIPPHPQPKINLEQYTTPSIIASDILWNAKNLNDIENKTIIDLGCGTGIFAIGSKLLNAKSSIGFDIDQDSINTAISMIEKFKLDNIEFHKLNVNETENLNEYLTDKVDTLFQNPPFGSQEKAEKGADTNFINLASKVAKVIYSFHMQSTEDYIQSYFENLDFNVTHKFYYEFPLPNLYKFHKKEQYIVNVVVIRAEYE